MAVWEVKSVFYDEGPTRTYVIPSYLAFTDVVTEQCAEGASVGPDARAEEG